MADANDINAVLQQLDVPVWLLTTHAGGRRGGLVATFVNAASIVPQMPRVAVGIARQHNTWGLVEASRSFFLHLVEESQLERVWRLGLRSGRDEDKLAGLPLVDTARLADAPAWLACRVETTLDIGDRTIYLAAVTAGRVERRVAPLTSQRLIALAPPERLAELRDGLRRDAEVDAAAIAAWRRTHLTP